MTAGIPVRIGPAGRELLGFLHGPQEPQPRALLVCAPFGQEAIRSQRMLRVLAERLGRQGWVVLRFDYFGAGDSPGDDADADLDGWTLDTLAAHRWLERQYPKAAISWLGLRLGGSVALRAMRSESARPPARLVLWEPVLDGKEWLHRQLDSHQRALEASYSLPRMPARLMRPLRETWPPTELMGFELPATMARQIEALRPHDLGAGPCPAVVFAPEPPPADWVQACAKRGGRPRHKKLAVDFDWSAEEALNTALVPIPAVNALLAAITEDHSA